MNKSKFEFNGEWEFLYELKELSKIFSFNGINKEPKIREKINIKILDKRDYESDPTNEQLNALRYIINNPNEIIESIYTQIIEIIFPLHKTYIDDEEIFFPKIDSKYELTKVLGLDEIVIHIESKTDMAYTSFVFEDFSADTEHGQTITMHKNRYIACSENWDYPPIYNDLGLDYKVKSKEDHEEYIKLHSKPLIFQNPIKKYNKLKPWQKDVNRLYPIRLIQNKKNIEFRDYLENHFGENQEIKLNELIYYANQSKNIEIEEILKKQK